MSYTKHMRIKIPTVTRVLLKYLLYLPLLTFFGLCIFLPLPFLDDSTKVIIAPILVMILWGGFLLADSIFVIPRIYQRKDRAKELVKVLDPGTYTLTNNRPAESPVFNSLSEGHDNRPRFQATGKDWEFTDEEFDIVSKSKYYSYVSSRVYYSILRIPLPRTLPHIIFDSRRMKGRQMYFNFDRNQRISLEGNFDQYFDTYFPASYEIDLLSIITPEIMETLIQASEFDIEIYGKSLILYSPMLPANQAPSAIQRASLIRDKLMNNIMTYSDHRLSDNNRKSVHAYGLTIQNNFRLRSLTTAAIGLFMIVLGIAIQFLPSSVDDASESLEKYLFLITLLVLGIALIAFAMGILKKGYKERDSRQAAAITRIPKKSEDN